MKQLSQKHKDKISQSLRGRKLSEEHKKKLSLFHKGKKLSDEHKKKIKQNASKFWFGKNRSEETKRRISRTRLERKIPSWNKGKELSEETKQKIRLKALGRKLSLDTIKKMVQSRAGYRHTEEIKQKMSGENHYNWKGGITKLTEQIRKSFEYRQWRSDVFTRDDFVCQECGHRGRGLIAHHIKEFSKILEEYSIKTFGEALDCEELWNINNGYTLCKKCHKNKHWK